MFNSHFRFCYTRDSEHLQKDTEKHHLLMLKSKNCYFLIIKIALQRSILETSGCWVIIKNESKTASLKKRGTLNSDLLESRP